MTAYDRLKRSWLIDKACARCGHNVWGEVCVHHSRGKLGSLREDMKHWIPLCLKCHTFVHNNIDEARKERLICEKGLWNSNL